MLPKLSVQTYSEWKAAVEQIMQRPEERKHRFLTSYDYVADSLNNQDKLLILGDCAVKAIYITMTGKYEKLVSGDPKEGNGPSASRSRSESLPAPSSRKEGPPRAPESRPTSRPSRPPAAVPSKSLAAREGPKAGEPSSSAATIEKRGRKDSGVKTSGAERTHSHEFDRRNHYVHKFEKLRIKEGDNVPEKLDLLHEYADKIKSYRGTVSENRFKHTLYASLSDGYRKCLGNPDSYSLKDMETILRRRYKEAQEIRSPSQLKRKSPEELPAPKHAPEVSNRHSDTTPLQSSHGAESNLASRYAPADPRIQAKVIEQPAVRSSTPQEAESKSSFETVGSSRRGSEESRKTSRESSLELSPVKKEEFYFLAIRHKHIRWHGQHNDIVSTVWYVNEHSRYHIACHKDSFYRYFPFNQPVEVRLQNDEYVLAEGKGLIITTDGPLLFDVHYSSQVQANFFSTRAARRDGITRKEDNFMHYRKHCTIPVKAYHDRPESIVIYARP